MDNKLLFEAIELSRSYERLEGMTPFGALVTLGGEVIGRGVSSVVASHDPTAHAEINAIREASTSINNHDLTGGEIYCSAFPCPLCLMACVWAGIKVVHYGAELSDTSKHGFEDSSYFEALRKGPEYLGIELRRASPDGRRSASSVVGNWKKSFDAGEWK